MDDYGSEWFDMDYGVGRETFEVEFEFNAWEDCYDSQDSRSKFWDWEYNVTRLYYLTEHGDEVEIDLDTLTLKQEGCINDAVVGEIERRVL